MSAIKWDRISRGRYRCDRYQVSITKLSFGVNNWQLIDHSGYNRLGDDRVYNGSSLRECKKKAEHKLTAFAKATLAKHNQPRIGTLEHALAERLSQLRKLKRQQ